MLGTSRACASCTKGWVFGGIYLCAIKKDVSVYVPLKIRTFMYTIVELYHALCIVLFGFNHLTALTCGPGQKK